MSAIRIIHKVDPARPESPDGIIEVEVNDKKIRMPHKGHDKVIRVRTVEFETYDELGKEQQTS